ncbi:hypothetical protein VNO77_23205 [Canavalia gladiata]|uniref:Uncharacterized protein n=1 Tax=Canavalia gladiata TaxID=3824 RepID=A0AAN9Q8Q0_CANGL
MNLVLLVLTPLAMVVFLFSFPGLIKWPFPSTFFDSECRKRDDSDLIKEKELNLYPMHIGPHHAKVSEIQVSWAISEATSPIRSMKSHKPVQAIGEVKEPKI